MSRLELEEPYKSKYSIGYKFYHSKEKRYYVQLIDDYNNRTTTSYARYLMSVKLGHFIPEELDVDHIDENTVNDAVDNLQLLTKVENIRKTKKNISYVTLICPVCKQEFTRETRQTYLIKGGNPTCCSRRCGGKASHNR